MQIPGTRLGRKARSSSAAKAFRTLSLMIEMHKESFDAINLIVLLRYT
jgi:hypothetical protein